MTNDKANHEAMIESIFRSHGFEVLSHSKGIQVGFTSRPILQSELKAVMDEWELDGLVEIKGRNPRNGMIVISIID